MGVAIGFGAPVGADRGDLLVLGHSLGTSNELWRDALPTLRQKFRVLEWELPGHGDATPAAEPFTVEHLTDALIGRLGHTPFHYAGVSIGGCVGLDLCLRHPDLVKTVAVISTGASAADPSVFHARAATARSDGMDGFAGPFRDRWFTPAAPTATVDRMLEALRRTDAESYALAAEALASFDVSDRLARIGVPLLAIAGRQDINVPPTVSAGLARSVAHGAVVVVENAAHCLVAEQPGLVARELIALAENRTPR